MIEFPVTLLPTLPQISITHSKNLQLSGALKFFSNSPRIVYPCSGQSLLTVRLMPGGAKAIRSGDRGKGIIDLVDVRLFDVDVQAWMSSV